MSLILKDFINKICIVYIDDILVFGKNIQEHDQNLKSVLKRLSEYDLEENKEKRLEKKEAVIFLGYEISLNKIKPALDRAQGIIDYKIPKTKKELQRFLGMINYDRIFVKNLSEELKDLYSLTGKDIKFCWTEKENLILNRIKAKLKEELQLFIPDFNIPFTLESDASNFNISAVLRQNKKPVGYISRILSKSEQKYSITEKETLAALWSMEKLEYFLLGKRFTLITDHKAI
ncbi:Retrovirus-related Pol polyprotein from transposon 17.6 [Dictyocoela muelleri]|nr:Retrovirus-related Pol polyprotein from transposon 17.6 [Dictyocoela muelleri]